MTSLEDRIPRILTEGKQQALRKWAEKAKRCLSAVFKMSWEMLRCFLSGGPLWADVVNKHVAFQSWKQCMWDLCMIKGCSTNMTVLVTNRLQKVKTKQFWLRPSWNSAALCYRYPYQYTVWFAIFSVNKKWKTPRHTWPLIYLLQNNEKVKATV